MIENVGDVVERRVRWTADDIVRLASDVGDTNPLHHDPLYAEGTRFGALIASGSHTVAYLIALLGAQSTPARPGVGLEFTFKLLGPARVGDELLFRWEILAKTESDRPKGTVLELNGVVVDGSGRTIVSATAKIL